MDFYLVVSRVVYITSFFYALVSYMVVKKMACSDHLELLKPQHVM